MAPSFWTTFLPGMVVGWVVMNNILWLASRKATLIIYGRAPWNWRVLLGTGFYTNWISK